MPPHAKRSKLIGSRTTANVLPVSVLRLEAASSFGPSRRSREAASPAPSPPSRGVLLAVMFGSGLPAGASPFAVCTSPDYSTAASCPPAGAGHETAAGHDHFSDVQ